MYAIDFFKAPASWPPTMRRPNMFGFILAVPNTCRTLLQWLKLIDTWVDATYLSIIITTRWSVVWSAALVLIVGMLQRANIAVVCCECVSSCAVHFATFGKYSLWSAQGTPEAADAANVGNWNEGISGRFRTSVNLFSFWPEEFMLLIISIRSLSKITWIHLWILLQFDCRCCRLGRCRSGCSRSWRFSSRYIFILLEFSQNRIIDTLYINTITVITLLVYNERNLFATFLCNELVKPSWRARQTHLEICSDIFTVLTDHAGRFYIAWFDWTLKKQVLCVFCHGMGNTANWAEKRLRFIVSNFFMRRSNQSTVNIRTLSPLLT